MRVLVQCRFSQPVVAMATFGLARAAASAAALPLIARPAGGGARTVADAAAARRDVATAGALAAQGAPSVPGLALDVAFGAVQLPARRSPGMGLATLAHAVTFDFTPHESTYLLRGTIPDDPAGQGGALAAAAAHPEIVGVFADPTIEPFAVYCGDPAVGAAADVATALGAAQLASRGLDGHGVDVAIVDTGVNLAHLRSLGRIPRLSVALSWTPPGVASKPGRHPLGHGTMCAFDATIAAPRARLLDYAVLLSGGTIQALLSNAVAAYGQLLARLRAQARPRPLVVSNSWGLFDPRTDFPVGHPGNYSDNPGHPFNVIVSSLEAAGADILFAAGNCGRDCPDGRCAFAGPPICGANSHPRVLSVAGVDVRNRRLGYSSQGPGRLSPQKPDLAAYTHFAGSGAFGASEPDSGTSAACPVAAGVIAAVRSHHGPRRVSPAQVRNLALKTAKDLGGVGWDDDLGWGLIQPIALADALDAAPAPAPALPPAPAAGAPVPT